MNHEPMPLAQAIGQLQGRMAARSDLHNPRVNWSVADVAAARVVLRELKRAQKERSEATALLASARRELRMQARELAAARALLASINDRKLKEVKTQTK